MGNLNAFTVSLLIGLFAQAAIGDDDRWWPTQTLPQKLIRTREHASRSHQMLVQSVAGLSAKAINQGRGDTMVWVYNHNADVQLWYEAFLKRNSSIAPIGEMNSWELVDHFAKQGLIKGYLLYTEDASTERGTMYRPGMNLSVNVATSLAGLLDAVIVSESLEAEAKSHGLSLLLDVRKMTPLECFKQYKDRFNRRLLCAQDPQKSNVRDLAIAQQALVVYGNDESLEPTMQWLEPLSPILGWNGGDEFESTQLSTRYGHIQTATDWCINLPVLMAGTDHGGNHAVQLFDPQTIDWNDKRSCVSFILTDGDNIQWLETTFYSNESFWGCPDRGKIPFGWSCCFAHLDQLGPMIIDQMFATKKSHDHLIEWGGGYYYPDLFGQSRPNASELLARHAQKTWKFMQQTGTRIVAFNVAKVDSLEALQSYETFVSQTDGLSAVLVFQYNPYEGGAGKTFWVKDRRGIEIPVISARYSIWEHANSRKRAGTPAKVAREIKESASGSRPRNDWVIVHAWSYFKRSENSDENAEQMPQQNAPQAGGVRGYLPTVWCAQRLPADVRIVAPDEIVWRIRMEHDQTTTRRLLHEMPAH